MDPITIAAVVAILEAVVKFVEEVPALMQAINTVLAALKSGQPLTQAQWDEVDALLQSTHAKLQGA